MMTIDAAKHIMSGVIEGLNILSGCIDPTRRSPEAVTFERETVFVDYVDEKRIALHDRGRLERFGWTQSNDLKSMWFCNLVP